MQSEDRKEALRYKALNLRYKKAALAMLQAEQIYSEIDNVREECTDLEWAIEDDETLLDVFDGDTDEIYEFRLSFNDLSNKCDNLICALNDSYVNEHFDDFFVGTLGRTYNMIGYDYSEEDYYNLTSFEADLAQGVSGKRLMGLTKEKLISTAGQCIGIMMCFLDIRHKYDYLKATFDLLKDDRAAHIKSVRAVEDAYEEMQKNKDDYATIKRYDLFVDSLPSRVWIE